MSRWWEADVARALDLLERLLPARPVPTVNPVVRDLVETAPGVAIGAGGIHQIGRGAAVSLAPDVECDFVLVECLGPAAVNGGTVETFRRVQTFDIGV